MKWVLIFCFCVLPLPAQDLDLSVGGRVLVQRCVLKNAPSSRMVAVGYPGGFCYAFDALHCAPSTTWTGGFLDFRGETTARGGNGCKALGVEQTFGTDRAPFRVGDAGAMPGSMRFLGYRRDAASGEPTFLFEVDGVSVEQRITSPAPGSVSLEFRFSGGVKKKKYYRLDPTPHLQIALGAGLRWSAPGVVEIPTEATEAVLTIELKSTGKTFVRREVKLTGAELYRNFCSACHSTDGSKLIGPTFHGMWSREQRVTRDGKEQKVQIDPDYVRESILKPQAAIVKGYEAVPMADFSSVLSRAQVDSLISYLQEIP